MNHFTDRAGYHAIASQVDWLFRAQQPPPRDHPEGVYFTNLPTTARNLAIRLRIPRQKLSHVFSFVERPGDLIPLAGGRGRFVFYSPRDYTVEPERQLESGETGL